MEHIKNSPDAVITIQGVPHDFNGALPQTTPIRNKDIVRLRKWVSKNKNCPYLVRLMWCDPESLSMRFKNRIRKTLARIPSKPSQYIKLESAKVGKNTLVMPGESVVFHPLMEHQTTIVGKYNPGLINSLIALVMGHKYVESLFWDKLCPEAMPKTILLSDHSSEAPSASEVKKYLDDIFPMGWVMKGVYDQATDPGAIITEKTDIDGAILKFKNSDFDKFRHDVDYIKFKNRDVYFRTLKEHEGFIGWRTRRMLKKPHFTVVQQRIDIEEEFRVEVVLGKALGERSTVPRHSFFHQFVYNSKSFESPSVEAWVQSMIEKLPEEFRNMPMAIDVAKIKDGSYKIIESNPQGNSAFFMSLRKSARALDQLLLSVPELHKDGKIHWGLDGKSQVQFIEQLLLEAGLDKKIHFPDLFFDKNRIIPDSSPMYPKK